MSPRGHCALRLNNSLESLPGSFDAVLSNHTLENDHHAVAFGAHHSSKNASHCRSRTWHGMRLRMALRGNIKSWLIGCVAMSCVSLDIVSAERSMYKMALPHLF
jgi:hypothetical protein